MPTNRAVMHSNKAVTVLEQCVANYVRIFMHFISDKCIVGEVGSYCQQAVPFSFWSHYAKPDNVVQIHFDPLPSISLDPALQTW